MWWICHLSSFNKNTTLVVLSILTCLEPQVSAHWCVLMRGVARCDLQSRIAQQGCSVPPANIFFSHFPVLQSEYSISGLCCCLAQFLISMSRCTRWNIQFKALATGSSVTMQQQGLLVQSLPFCCLTLFMFSFTCFPMACTSNNLVSWTLSEVFLFFFHVVYKPVTSKCPVWLDGQCYQISADCCPTREKNKY